MKLRAIHVWIAALPPFLASLLLPVASAGWLDGPFEVHGLMAAWWMPVQSLTSTAIFLAKPSISRVDNWWFEASYGIAIILVVLSPLFIFTRIFALRHWMGVILVFGQFLFFVGTFLGPLFWPKDSETPFQFLGYWAFGAGLLILSVSYIIKIKEVEQCDPPNGYPRHASC
jgi:hypothetical protein